jgi:hypothetical protein
LGNNSVGIEDISRLNTTYWKSHGEIGYNNICDVGPTTDRSVHALPLTDNTVQFEDLMMFAINYGQVSLLASGGARTLERPWLALEFEEGSSERTDVVRARLVLKGNRESVKGIHAAISCPSGLEFEGMSGGRLLKDQSGPVFLEHLAEGGLLQVDAALLGRGQTLHGSGDVVELRFRVVGTVETLPGLYEVDLRSVSNRTLDRDMSPELGLDDTRGERPGETVARVELSARPNPFSGGTHLRLSLPHSTPVKLRIYSVSGQLVETLVDGELGAGHHGLTWRASGAAPGVYLAILDVGGERLTRKLTLLP